MENKSNMSNASMGMGGTLIIIIFVVLCLTVFSVLSFTTAYSDLKLARKTEQLTHDYYEIHGRAEEKVAEIYATLMSVNEIIISENFKKEDFMKRASEAVVKLYGVSTTTLSDDSFSLYYESLGEENQKICVTLKVMYDETKNIPYYNIETWNLSPIKLPIYEEENYNLWEGFE